MVGTLPYMSPQLRKTYFRSGKYDAIKADVFALGMTIYALASLSQPEVWQSETLEQTAKKHINSLSYSDSIKTLLLAMLSFSEEDRPSMQEVIKRASPDISTVSMRRAVQAREAGDCERTAQALITKKANQDSLTQAKTALEHGTLLSRVGKWTEALSVLTEGLNFQQNAELTLQFYNILVETHYQAAEWAETIPICQQILSQAENWSAFEQLRAIYYLLNSHYYLGNQQEMDTAWEWAQIIAPDSPNANCLSLLITASRLNIEGNKEEAVSCFQKGLEIAQKLLPNSLITVCSLLDLALLYYSQGLPDAEPTYLLCKSLSLASFPHSQSLTNCLYALGVIYDSTRRRQEAEQAYLQCKDLCLSHFPYSLTFANCLYSLGVIYDNTNRLERAEEVYFHCKELTSEYFPESQILANSLLNLGLVYKNTNRLEEAKQAYVTCVNLCWTHFPHSQTLALCLYNLGLLYKITNNPVAAEETFNQYIEISHSYPPHLDTLVKCLIGLGSLYKDTNRLSEAEQTFISCKDFCITHFPSSESLIVCLLNLGIIYQNTKRLEQAKLAYLHCRDLSRAYFPHSDTLARCLSNLGVLYQSLALWEEAEQAYSQCVNLSRTYFPQSKILALSLLNLGLLYKLMNRNEEAIQVSLQCLFLCNAHFSPSQILADCLYHLSVLYESEGRKDAAVGNMQGALEVFARLGKQGDVEECQRNLQRLRN